MNQASQSSSAEPTLDTLKQLCETLQNNDAAAASIIRWAVEQIEEYDHSFDLRWKADMRAIQRWQAAHPGRELTWPDHADLCVWLLERIETSTQPMDKGPWDLFYSAPPERRIVGVISDDFTHDVVLRVDGDFGSDEQKLEYCKQLLAALNTKPGS